MRKDRSRWCLGGQSCDRTSRSVVKCPICQSIEIESMNHVLKSLSLGQSMPDAMIQSWVVMLSPQQNLSTIVMGSAYPEVDKVLELINICIDIFPSLKIPLRF
jgi:hypothetical protein